MVRFVIAALFLAILASLIAILLALLSRVAQVADSDVSTKRGSQVQKIAFFLLLCLMIYVAMSGAS